MQAPSETQLAKVERALKKLPRGAQRSVGGGVYMRLNREGRRRFQFRARSGGRHGGGTYDSWQGAFAARDELESEAEAAPAPGEPADTATPELADRAALRKLTLTRYGSGYWWPGHVLTDLERTTQTGYRQSLGDALAVGGHYTLEQLEERPMIVDEIKRRLKQLKTCPADHPHTPNHFASAAADHALKVLSAICEHAHERGIISRNPFAGVLFFHVTRGRNGKKSSGHREIKPSEVVQPVTVAAIAFAMPKERRRIAELEQDRLIPELIAYGGLRPQDVMGMRHSWWRDENGPRSHIRIGEAVKDIRGHLETGEPKTGVREPVLWPAIAEQLERIYQAQGRPPLDALVFPHSRRPSPENPAGFQNWGNWCRDHWYQALHAAGLIEQACADALGAFDPYLLRHVGVQTMLHAQRPPEQGGGTYSRYEVARHFGHTVDTLDKVYAGIPEDMLGIAGLTVDEIIRHARRQTWGPLPGEPDYQETYYPTDVVARLAGISVNALCARLQRGRIPARKADNGYSWQIEDHTLVLLGLLPPQHHHDERERILRDVGWQRH